MLPKMKHSRIEYRDEYYCFIHVKCHGLIILPPYTMDNIHVGKNFVACPTMGNSLTQKLTFDKKPWNLFSTPEVYP